MISSCKYVLLVLMLSALAVHADDEYYCSPLDPRVELSSSSEGKLAVDVGTTFKIVKAGGEISGKVANVTTNIQKNFPLSEQANATNRFLYLFCKMMTTENFTPDKKFEMYKYLLDRFVPPITSVAPNARVVAAPVVPVVPVVPAAPVTKASSQERNTPKDSGANSRKVVKGEAKIFNEEKTPPPVVAIREPVNARSPRDAFFSGKPIAVIWPSNLSKRVEPVRFIFTLKNNMLNVSGVYFKMSQSPELKSFYDDGEMPRASMTLAVHGGGSMSDNTANYCCWKVDFGQDNNWPSVFSSNVVASLKFPFGVQDVDRPIEFYYDLVFLRDTGKARRFDADINSKNIWRLIDSGVVAE